MTEEKKPAAKAAKTLPLAFTQTLFVIGLGTKGARRNMSGTVALDAAKIPPHINDAIYQKGAYALLNQASQDAERKQVREWCEKTGKKEEDAPAFSRFPFDFARLERDAIAAMEARVQQWYAGDIGRGAGPMNALERRASQLVEAKLRAYYVSRKQAVPEADELAAIVQKVLADPVKGEEYRATAKAQLLAEQQAATEGAEDLASFAA